MKIRHLHSCIIALVTTVAAAPMQAQQWNGFYLGTFAGAGTGSYKLGVSAENESGPTVDIDDIVYGFHAGRRLQFGSSVIGTDLGIMNGPSGTKDQGPDAADRDWNCATGDCNVSIDTVVTGRVSYGVAVAPQTLIYAAAGLAMAEVEGGVENSIQQGSSTAFGYTVGLGVERQIPNGLTVFSEAGFYDLGDLEFGEGEPGETFDGDGDFATLKIGINLRF